MFRGHNRDFDEQTDKSTGQLMITLLTDLYTFKQIRMLMSGKIDRR